MSIKLALLKSGEQIIADIRELVDQDQNDKVVSLLFSNPYVVRLLTSSVLFEENDSPENEYKVSFYPWIPLSEDKDVPVNPDWVVTVVEPNTMVKESYEQKMSGSVDGVKGIEEKVIDNLEVIQE